MPTSKLDTMIAERRRAREQRTPNEVAADHLAAAELAAHEQQETLDPAAAAERERDKAQWLQMLRSEGGYRDYTSAPRTEAVTPAVAVDVVEPEPEPPQPVPPQPDARDWQGLDAVLVAAGMSEFKIREYRAAFEMAARAVCAWRDPLRYAADRAALDRVIVDVANVVGTPDDRAERFLLQSLVLIRAEAYRQSLLQVYAAPAPAPADPSVVASNNSAEARLDRIEAMVNKLVAKGDV